MKTLYVKIKQSDFDRLRIRFAQNCPVNMLKCKISKFWDKLFDLIENEDIKFVCFISPKKGSAKIYTNPEMMVRYTKEITTYESSYPTVKREFYYKYGFTILKIE